MSLSCGVFFEGGCSSIDWAEPMPSNLPGKSCRYCRRDGGGGGADVENDIEERSADSSVPGRRVPPLRTRDNIDFISVASSTPAAGAQSLQLRRFWQADTCRCTALQLELFSWCRSQKSPPAPPVFMPIKQLLQGSHLATPTSRVASVG